MHGIGKTELVKDLSDKKNIPLVYIAPAQFEEMGDLIGMPRLDAETDLRTVTQFAPPAWTPTQEGPGILLLDDFNRADDRILRGVMQLLQYYELVSWALPPKWLIVLTANPDGGDYSVTSMDDAMLTRMLHVTMQFDVKAWARWAERSGVDPRGIAFVLAYPELINGKRTTPRSLVQFFEAIRVFDELNAHLPMIKMLGEASLEKETIEAFVQFVHLKLDQLPSPQDLLNTDDFEALEAHIRQLVNEENVQRMDILSLLVSRVNNHLLAGISEPGPKQIANLKRFILSAEVPNDLRLAMAQELSKANQPALSTLYSDPEISRILLEKM
jgi:MoxR-like ATPase